MYKLSFIWLCIVFGAFLVSAESTCRTKCIANFDEESMKACIGACDYCELSTYNKPNYTGCFNCTENCESNYKEQSLIACTAGCVYATSTAMEASKPTTYGTDWIRRKELHFLKGITFPKPSEIHANELVNEHAKEPSTTTPDDDQTTRAHFRIYFTKKTGITLPQAIIDFLNHLPGSSYMNKPHHNPNRYVKIVKNRHRMINPMFILTIGLCVSLFLLSCIVVCLLVRLIKRRRQRTNNNYANLPPYNHAKPNLATLKEMEANSYLDTHVSTDDKVPLSV